MFNIVLEVAYDGTEFYGFQKTKTGPSIENTLENVLEQLLQEKIALQAASRTDRGVHAFGQVVNFFTTKKHDIEKLHYSLNKLLPKSIVIRKASQALPSFHPTTDVQAKEYRYAISQGSAQLPHLRYTHWHIYEDLNIEAMQKAAELFIGTHDFASFCNFRKNLRYENTIRTITSVTIEEQENGCLLIRIIGTHFLYKMVRNIVGTLVYVGLNKLSPLTIPRIFESKSRPTAGITAPAHGLSLYKIYY